MFRVSSQNAYLRLTKDFIFTSFVHFLEVRTISEQFETTLIKRDFKRYVILFNDTKIDEIVENRSRRVS